MEEVIFLVLTIAIEFPIAVAIMPKKIWKQVGWVVLCVNMITHPLAWLLLSKGVPWIHLEIGVLMTEAAVFAKFFPACRKHAIAAAGMMNIVSAGIGAIFF